MFTASDSYVEYPLARDFQSMTLRLGEAALYTSLAPPGTRPATPKAARLGWNELFSGFSWTWEADRLYDSCV